MKTRNIRPAHNVTAAVLGLTMVSGVYIDGWAHVTRPGMETFFTPWHGILYSGFALLAALIVGVSVRRDHGWRLNPPPAYRLALVGVAVFLAGGVGDMIWHELFGIEAAVDALVSPTHLMLLVGAMLMITAPARAAGSDTSPASVAATAVSVATTAAAAAFFLSYLSIFADPVPVLTPLTSIPEGMPGHREAELPTIVGFGSYLATTAAILVPILVLSRLRTRVPAGVPTATVAVVALLGALLSEFRFMVPALGAIAGALLFELSKPLRPTRISPWIAIGAGLPVLTWAGHLAALALTEHIAWTVTLWAGVIVLTALGGVALALLAPSAPSEPIEPAGT